MADKPRIDLAGGQFFRTLVVVQNQQYVAEMADDIGNIKNEGEPQTGE